MTRGSYDFCEHTKKKPCAYRMSCSVFYDGKQTMCPSITVDRKFRPICLGVRQGKFLRKKKENR